MPRLIQNHAAVNKLIVGVKWWEILHPEHFQLLGDIGLIELYVCQASNNLSVVRK
jgi:hypothetical protein